MIINKKSKDIKDGRTNEIIRELASEYILRNSGPASLITVTRTEYSHEYSKVKVFFTVLPDHKKDEASDFLRRHSSDFYEYLKNKSSLSRIPKVEFIFDVGEKNRQRLDELSSMV